MAKVRGVVLCSGSASSFRFLQAHDPHFGDLYDIVGVFSDVPSASGISLAKENGVPTAVLDFEGWRKARGIKRRDLVSRQVYFGEVLDLIAPWSPSFIMLSGFMLLVTDPLYAAFEDRILNVHPALLSICNADGTRRYTGLDVVRRAMEAGDPTGSTVHLVTKEADMGPIVVESSPLPYQSGDDPDVHQSNMKDACDGPAFQAALAKLIEGGWPRRPWRSESL